MPGESPTKWQAQAYRFGVRRLESAVSSGDPLLRGDPLRRRLNLSLIISFVIAALICGAFAVYGFIKPEPSIGSASVVIDSDTGGVFVSRAGRLYPAMNYSSALLAAGRGNSNNSAPSTTTVDSSTVGKEPRGPLLGIPGAPNVLPSGSDLTTAQWTVCDRTTVNGALPPGSAPTIATTAIIGQARPVSGALGTRAMLVTPDSGATTYLLWSGHRSVINPADQTIRLAFGLGSADTPRPISAALLNVVPQSPDITVPSITVPATTPAYATALGVQVGEVFALKRADGSKAVYVALPDGVQRINSLVGDLIRDQYSVVKNVPLIAPKLLRQAPLTTAPITLANYPTVRPDILGYASYPVTCVARTGAATTNAAVYALSAVPVPGAAKPVTVTQPGDLTVDDVYIHPGHGAVFSAATAAQASSQSGVGTRALYVITDEGVAYPVVSGTALTYLGYGAADVVQTAPELLSLLPKGPALDPDQAAHFYPQTGASASSLPTASAADQSPSG